jgi:hypothetical protein
MGIVKSEDVVGREKNGTSPASLEAYRARKRGAA